MAVNVQCGRNDAVTQSTGDDGDGDAVSNEMTGMRVTKGMEAEAPFPNPSCVSAESGCKSVWVHGRSVRLTNNEVKVCSVIDAKEPTVVVLRFAMGTERTDEDSRYRKYSGIACLWTLECQSRSDLLQASRNGDHPVFKVDGRPVQREYLTAACTREGADQCRDVQRCTTDGLQDKLHIGPICCFQARFLQLRNC